MKSIVRIHHLPSVVQSEFNEVTRILFLRKENKTTILFNICLLCFSIAPFWKISTGRKQLLCQPRHKDTSSMLVYALNWIKNSASVWRGWHAACVQRIFSKMALHWHRGDELLNKVVFLFSLCRKSILVASLNSDWTTDGRWSILTMLLILLWTLTVQFTMQSMGQSQASRFSSKIS